MTSYLVEILISDACYTVKNISVKKIKNEGGI